MVRDFNMRDLKEIFIALCIEIYGTISYIYFETTNRRLTMNKITLHIINTLILIIICLMIAIFCDNTKAITEDHGYIYIPIICTFMASGLDAVVYGIKDFINKHSKR
jgi:hypothetical protein